MITSVRPLGGKKGFLYFLNSVEAFLRFDNILLYRRAAYQGSYKPGLCSPCNEVAGPKDSLWMVGVENLIPCQLADEQNTV